VYRSLSSVQVALQCNVLCSAPMQRVACNVSRRLLLKPLLTLPNIIINVHNILQAHPSRQLIRSHNLRKSANNLVVWDRRWFGRGACDGFNVPCRPLILPRGASGVEELPGFAGRPPLGFCWVALGAEHLHSPGGHGERGWLGWGGWGHCEAWGGRW